MSQENISAIHPHRLGLGGLRRPLGMMRWSVDGGELQRIVADVDDVVPGSGRNADAVPGTEVLAEAQLIWAAAHPHGALPLFDAYDVVGILHDLKSHVGAGWYAHDSHLHEASGPYGIAIMVVLHGFFVKVNSTYIVIAVVSVLGTVVITIHRISPFYVFNL